MFLLLAELSLIGTTTTTLRSGRSARDARKFATCSGRRERLPSISEARAIGTWVGSAQAVGRGMTKPAVARADILDHAKTGGRWLSMVGGKLASYRLFSEEMTDLIAEKLGRGSPCQSHTLALPGGDEAVDPMRLVLEGGMEAVTATRLEYRHGSRSLRILERMRRDPREAAVACVCEPVTVAEIRYVIDQELASNVEDVSRRTRLGLGACGGMRCAARCGRIVATPRQEHRSGLGNGHPLLARALEAV